MPTRSISPVVFLSISARLYFRLSRSGSLIVSSSYYYEIYVPAMIGLFVSHFYASAGGRRLSTRPPEVLQGELPPEKGPESHAW